MQTRTRRALAATIGLALGGVTFAIGGGLRLAVLTALLWAGAGELFGQWYRLDPSPSGSSWETGGPGSVAYVLGLVGPLSATMIGVVPTSIETGVGFGLALVVLGAGSLAFAAGVVVGFERGESPLER